MIKIPYSLKAKYYHHVQKDTRSFRQSSFRIVPLSHTNYNGKKFNKYKDKAIIGYNLYSKKYDIQSILVPK